MNDRALRYFLAVARTGSIRAAAEMLNVAPSAVSRQISELEGQCNSLLIERMPRGVVLTEAGRLVAEHAQRQADDVTLLIDRLGRLHGLQQGIVHLCCGAGFLPDMLDNGLASFAAAHPGISYSVSLGTTDSIIKAVAVGDADIGVAYNPTAHPEVRPVVTSRQPIAAIVPMTHTLARGRRPVSLRAFAGEAAALLPPDHGLRRLLARVEADNGFRLITRLESPSFELHRRFVAAGMGVAFMPEFVAFSELRDGQVAAVPLSDPLLSEATAHLVVRIGRRLPAATEVLLNWLAENLISLGNRPRASREAGVAETATSESI